MSAGEIAEIKRILEAHEKRISDLESLMENKSRPR